jgi:short subunit dehydrogenase-like uncharacterized protein
MRQQREHDLVLVGATGFVGRLTAAHLARTAPAGTRVALAGRSLPRLERLRAELPGTARDWPLLVVDVSSERACDELAAATRVVATTVGPYAVHGLPLVRACARSGTHYADLTGEVLFVRRSIEQAHDAATASGARIVHSCGFDSVPSDLAMMLAHEAARADGAGRIVEATLHVRRVRAGISGGTVDSMRQQVVALREDPSTRRTVADPDALAATRTAYGRGPAPVARSRRTGRWHGPFVMAGYNTRVVRRSWSLVEGAEPLLYDEVVDTGRGWRGPLKAAAVAGGTAGLAAAMGTAPTRRLADRMLPAPGEGPSDEKRKAGMFEVETEAVTTLGAHYVVTVGAPYDPGYDGTAVMLGQAALALVAGEGSDRVGVLTPWTALGEALADRLRRFGFTLEVRRETGVRDVRHISK